MSKDDCLGCLCASCMCFAGLAIVAGSISILVFSIMGLVEDWNLVEECENSNMHVYVIVSLILAYASGGSVVKSKGEEIVAMVCSILISIAMFI